MKQEKLSFTVIGGGTAGWLSALALLNFSKSHEKPFRISIIVPEDIPTIGVGEATVDSFLPFTESIGINTLDLLRETGASFKQTIYLKDWLEIGKTYYHPFYEKSLPLGILLDAVSSNHDFEDLFLNVHLAQKHKAPYHGSHRAGCGIHFDNFHLASYFKKLAIAGGVEVIQRKVSDFDLSPDGGIACAVLEDGVKHHSDYFFDCSGFVSLLLGKKLKTPYHDFSKHLLNNSAVAFPKPYAEGEKKVDPWTQAQAMSHGWAWRIPLQDRIGMGYVYSDQYISSTEAEKEFRLRYSPPETLVARPIKFRIGHYEEIFRHNCLGVGLSSGFIEPLESTGILFITKVLEAFGLFLQGKLSQEDVNQKMDLYYTSTRDFLFLHYKLTQRSDTQYWRDVKDIPFPETLKEKWELFKEIKLGKNDESLVKKLTLACSPWDPKAYLFILSGLNYFGTKSTAHPYDGVLKKFKNDLEVESELYADNLGFLSRLKNERGAPGEHL